MIVGRRTYRINPFCEQAAADPSPLPSGSAQNGRGAAPFRRRGVRAPLLTQALGPSARVLPPPPQVRRVVLPLSTPTRAVEAALRPTNGPHTADPSPLPMSVLSSGVKAGATYG